MFNKLRGRQKWESFFPRKWSFSFTLTLLHSEQPKLNGVLAILSAIGLTVKRHWLGMKKRPCLLALIFFISSLCQIKMFILKGDCKRNIQCLKK